MYCQFVCILVLCFFVLILHCANAIVGRDLVLTPKRGQQLNGKKVFYEEDSLTKTAQQQNQTILRPWERTLKHVTYITLFTNAAADAVAGNTSKQTEYNDFLYSPYIPQRIEVDTRFGDIVTLARGRLVEMDNNTFRFVEGSCDYDCAAERVWALWQVQKIRHRDMNRKFRYEMKFSVSPLRKKSASENGSGNIKRKAELESGNSKRSISETYIQRDDDYPKAFGKIISTSNDDYARFAERRIDNFNIEENFKQMTTADQQYQEATPIPEATFMHGIFQPHPHHAPLLPEQLNIGEYVREYTPQATPKIEHYSTDTLNDVHRNYYPPAHTTQRPNYLTKFPRPELYTPPIQHEAMKFPHLQELSLRGAVNKLTTPVVTHHFHHHFYMPTTTNIENGLNSVEQPLNTPKQVYKGATSPRTTSNHFSSSSSFYNGRGQTNFPTEPAQATKTVNFPQTDMEFHKQKLVHVTPVPPLKKPLVYQMYQIPIESKGPLLIYPAPVVEEQTTLPNSNKPFIRSEPMGEERIRYSEPDPLYLNLAHNPSLGGQHGYEITEPQLEAPKPNRIGGYASQHTGDILRRKSSSPDIDQAVSIPYEDETIETNSKRKHDLEQRPSQKDIQIEKTKTKQRKKVNKSTVATTTESSTTTTEMPIETTSSLPDTTTMPPAAITTKSITNRNQELETAVKRSTSAVQTTTTNPTSTADTLNSATTALPFTSTTPNKDTMPPRPSTKYKKSTQNFISTSTVVTPSLRALSRYRLKHSRLSATTTTEQPVLKWRPRRKHSTGSPEGTTSAADEETTRAQMQSATTIRTPFAQKTVEREEKNRHTIEQPNEGNDKEFSEIVIPTTIKPTNDSLLLTAKANEVFEVLTQKSISKSVSIKVGDNGKEMPVVIDDNDYEENVAKANE